MGIIIEDLPATAGAQNDHVIPAMRSGETVKLTAQQLATFIIAIVTDSAPATLDTLNELAAALGDDPNFATTMTNALATKASLTGTETLTNKSLTSPIINNAPSGEFLRGHISGLTLSNNATDATNDIDIASGSSASDGTTPALMTLASGITKRLDAAWAVGSGNGGLDTGSIANGTYHVFLIMRSDTGTVDVIFSASTSPTMPAFYDHCRRIGSIIRSAGNILPFKQDGDHFTLVNSILDVNVADQGGSNITRTLTVPTGIVVLARIRVFGLNASGWVMTVRSNREVAVGPGTATPPIGDLYAAGGTADVATIDVLTDTSASVRSMASSPSTTLRISTHGWVDIRGRI